MVCGSFCLITLALQAATMRRWSIACKQCCMAGMLLQLCYSSSVSSVPTAPQANSSSRTLSYTHAVRFAALLIGRVHICCLRTLQVTSC